MIDRGLEGTSVTCVLAGYETWNRPWVRYEIAKSVVRGNGLVAVYINNCKCPRDGYSLKGPNPPDKLAIGYDAQMRRRIKEGFNWMWRTGRASLWGRGCTNGEMEGGEEHIK